MGLTAQGCNQRREALIKQIEADRIVITNPRHILYLSGLYITPLALSGWGPTFLIIEAGSGRSRLLVHNFIENEALSAHVDAVDVWQWYDAASDPGVSMFPQAVRELKRHLGDMGEKRVAVEFGWFPVGVEVVGLVDVTPILLEMRRRKYPDELALIRDAIRAVEAGHRAARETIRPGLTELEVYNAIHDAMVREAGQAILMLGDFVSGERTYTIGGPATERVLRAGELMILDLFPIVSGYRADFTATVSVDGQLTDQQRKLDIALQAGISAGESLLKAGNRASDVYRAVKDALTEHGFGQGFTHHAGHGLGLGHPEAPYFVPNSDEILVEGDVVTLEPGSYGSSLGARIEHNYLITADGFERLTNHQTTFI